MMTIITMIGGVVLLSIMSTTKEQRAEAKPRMDAFGRKLLPFVIAGWLFVIAAFIVGSRHQ